MTSDADGDEYFVTFSPVQFRDWVIATVIPAHDFLASIEESAETLLVALVVLVLAMAVLAVLLTNNLVARPLGRIAAAARPYREFPSRSGRARAVAAA